MPSTRLSLCNLYQEDHKILGTLGILEFCNLMTMHMAMPIFWDVTHRLEETFINLLHNGCTELNMADLDVPGLIGHAEIDKSFDTLAEVSPSEYMFAAKQLICYFPFPFQRPSLLPLQDFMRLIPYIVKFGSPDFRGFLARIAPHANMRKLREITYFQHNTNTSICWEIIHSTEQASKVQNNQGVNATNKLSDDETISQIQALIFAGQHTTSVGLSRILQVLSLDPERQKRLGLELINARAERRDLSYDDLMALLPYLDAFYKGTLQLLAPVPQLHRVDSSIPLSRPVMGKDGSIRDHIHVHTRTVVSYWCRSREQRSRCLGTRHGQAVSRALARTLSGDC
ncbi:hypothetical protein B0F90DRAFT_435161 [Multifurca ochricompacta]|uniref:Cytochrome P450 n=1 Tax=Multifurca ochricompacta TaxID=376703 RepID=A0AAD4QNE6_9AGAM|nr:hypothetical protein B0F90DRAFT_435161 [Multifurca ochricompacta]